MSTDRPDDCRPLEEYISDLIGTLASEQFRLFDRMRQVVGDRSARIDLDEESVVVRFVGGALRTDTDLSTPADGYGATDSTTVVDILDGLLDVSEAITTGRLRVVGEAEDIHRMFLAIEILLDASARSYRLQAIAADFRADPCHQRVQPHVPHPTLRLRHPVVPSDSETALLDSLGLLPDH